ncbi:MAG: 2-hydroxyacyl-CoA dehydratase subunit D [Gemmatimonadota bacterium]
MSENGYVHQGTGRELQKRLLAEYFGRVNTARERDEKVAYVFISGNIAEYLRSFGFHLVYPEVTSLQCGIKRMAGTFIGAAEDLGYSPDVCGYVKNDIGLAQTDGTSPLGKLPPPDVLLCNYAGCRTYIKWFEALAEHYGAPLVMLDVPYQRHWGREAEDFAPDDVAYVTDQLRELIPRLEAIADRSYDDEAHHRMLADSVVVEDVWSRILQSARHRPAPLDAYFEAVFFMAPLYILRGLPECREFYEATWLEIQERIEHGIGPIEEERFRVVVEGPPPWPHFRAFWEMFKRWGAVSVASSYAKVGGIFDRGFRHDPERPLESQAEYCLNCYTNLNLGLRTDLLQAYAEEYEADGIVIHSVKSCRSFSVGQADLREALRERMGLPTLFVESDLADPRYFQAAQLQNRIDAFFEGLKHQRLVVLNEPAPC